MKKIGIIGLGNIFTKAYLPIITSKQDTQWVLYSTNEDKLKQLELKHGFKNTENDFEKFLNSGLDAVFIHTPTYTHAKLIETFLNNNIHVFVDKPISDNLDDTKRLLELANNKKLILMTGFNRRHAPLTIKLKEIENKSMIVIRKNREHTQQETRFALYDMMIHVVDTALYLLDEPVESYNCKLVENGYIERAILNIETKSSSLIAYMNLNAGARHETYEVMSPTQHSIVYDMNEMHETKVDKTEIMKFSDWTPTLEKRGFENLINTFLEKLETKDNTQNMDALLSHEMIESFLK